MSASLMLQKKHKGESIMEKKDIKISLGTAICIVIIIILMVGSVFAFYYGYIKGTETNIIMEKKAEKVEERLNLLIKYSQEEKLTLQPDRDELRELSNTEIKTILAPEDAYFCIENIEQDGEEYIITANMLEKQTRVVSKEEYENLLNGGEIKFRNLKWKKDDNSEYNYEGYTIIKSGNSSLAIYNKEESKRIYNVAGAKKELCDYSLQIIKFRVSKDILIGNMFTEFKYDENGKIKIYDFEGNPIESPSLGFDHLLKFSEGCQGSYEECKAYVKDGIVDAIQIFSD